MRIGFFGTPHLASTVLEDLINAPHIEVAFVVTGTDKPIGRSATLTPTPVKTIAEQRKIPVYTPEKIRGNEQLLSNIGSYNCDFFVVVAYGKILPKALLDIPKYMCVNIHGSILPKYRGASPIQSALLSGEKETGVTIMQMSEKMDEGDTLSIHRILIDPGETTKTLFEKFEKISGEALIQTLEGIESGSIVPIPQDHDHATYCTKIEKSQGHIQWNESADTIYHRWQAYTPWPGIYTFYRGKRLILESVSYINKRHDIGHATMIRDASGTIQVACNNGFLILHTVKLEGKRSQSAEEFVRTHPECFTTILE